MSTGLHIRPTNKSQVQRRARKGRDNAWGNKWVNNITGEEGEVEKNGHPRGETNRLQYFNGK